MPLRPARTADNPNLNKAKLAQAILFFLHHANNEQLGKTKLMKLLYYADFDHFEQYDESITGARYRKLDHGPVPDDAAVMLDGLEKEGRVRCRKVRVGGYEQDKYDPLEDVDVSVFTAAEIDTLHQVVGRWAAHTTKQIENATHGEAPWIAVRWNEEIPYDLAYYRNTHGAMDLDEDEFLVPDERVEEEAALIP